MTASFAPTARTLEFPGARLYHEVCGKGPLLLLVGAPMDAGGRQTMERPVALRG